MPYIRGKFSSYKRTFDYFGSRSYLFSPMAAWLMDCGLPDIARRGHTAFGNAQFKLSAFLASDVSGVSGVGVEIFTGGAVFRVDMVQQTLKNSDKTRYTLLSGGTCGKWLVAAALKGIVF